jgi:putative DNA primase/helicase
MIAANDSVPERDDDPHRLARLFAAGYCTTAGERTLARWRSQFYRWDSGAYARLTDESVRAELTTFVRKQFERDYAATEGNEIRPKAVRPVRQGLVSDVLGALHGMVAVPFGVNQPGWLDGTKMTADTVNTPNAIVTLSALADGRADAVREPSPKLFTTTKTGVRYDPNADAPTEWLKFLSDLWPDDPDSAACLQQWFGYLLTADTRQQKMLLLVGPTRSGKGTIAGVLRALLGDGSVAGPTLNSLATNFGLSPMLDRSVAIIDDARLSGRTDAATVAERLLTITGEGLIDVDRKHLPAVPGAKLGTRFVVISNELPKFGDASGALVGRMIVLRFTRSFFGHEDHGLKDRLMEELPGIMLWAIEGWKTLRTRGRFVQPARGQEMVDELHDLSSPVGAFVREKCITGPGLSVGIAELFEEWKRWCEAAGKQQAGTVNGFGRDLRAVISELEVKQPRGDDGRQVRRYYGVALRASGDSSGDTHAGAARPVCRPAGAGIDPLTRTRRARDAHADTHENATLPSLTRMTRTTSDSSTGSKEEGRERESMARNKELCVSCVSDSAEGVAQLLPDRPAPTDRAGESVRALPNGFGVCSRCKAKCAATCRICRGCLELEGTQ